ncbi:MULTISPECIES: hypothetical protein [unclassified Paenibacillus]|uniref:hypothetical protein n=1 Tax=unclassified Paenibacillus TaxID=185978 RepID=UPI000894C6FC|nr:MULTISPECIES: hypothetical protein [unclassified Paenibacillus]OMC68646.1 hypothetical protein BK126_12520 [Paenibacillus sp. FSL H7-0326]SDW56298.1 hypothetical protein SAMN05518848_102189 [Paenibacillus sp. PDC88]
MAGIVNDNIVFPVLDLIHREIRKYTSIHNIEGNPLEGEPSVTLFREHPMDTERVTGADMIYESTWRVSIWMKFGSEDDTGFPVGVGYTHPDYSYYKYFRLTQVTSRTFDASGESVLTYHIGLNYDDEGRLTGTSVNRI